MALRYALLGALADQPRTGYALLKHFEQSLAYAWPASHSQIYPELARLLDDGLIEQTGSGARNSKTYAVTDRGLDEIRRWLRESEPDRRVRSDAALRTFFLWLLEPAEAAERARGRARVLAGRARRVPADPGRADGPRQEVADVPHRARGWHRRSRGAARVARERPSPRSARPQWARLAGLATQRSASHAATAQALHRARAAVVHVQAGLEREAERAVAPGARSRSRRSTPLPAQRSSGS